ncbi:hypothetical protein ONE63_008109 [Megalurothrips usitatus]|uniref:Reverse transcriptase domain-containing protein n=1 Tax=Megalurothrips usitatus TaxID=439358 RepID=A0AAV7XLI3_9NEOP|nr:hypothetical protein ONE63_008109 [Megalurothrips usitatus]
MVLGWLSDDCDFPVGPSGSASVCSISPATSPPSCGHKPRHNAPPDFNLDINPELPASDRQKLQDVLDKFRHCFVTSENQVGLLEDVPESKLHVSDDRIIRTPPFKLAPAELEFLKEQMKGLEEGGLISRTNSSYRNPIIVIPVWDFRKLNRLLQDQPYDAIPMESLLEKVHGFKYFAVLGLKLAYLQCPLDQASRQYTAFQVPGIGTFHFNGIPIGTKTAPVLFQYVMEYIFGQLREKFPILSYFDDNLCCANSIDDLTEILSEFLSLADKHGISLSAKKCSFGYNQVKFPGFQFENGKVTLPESRLEKLRQLQPPSDYKALQSICGVLNHLRRFIPSYGNIAAPIVSLLSKPREFAWEKEQQEAFDRIKSVLLKNLPLYSFHPDYHTFLYTDASHQSAGAALFQKRPDCPRAVPVEFYSRTWSKSEKNWPIFHKEFAAAALAVRHFRHLLLGKFFTLLTDSQPLSSHRLMKPEGRLAKFCLVLSQYNFDIKWIEGRRNVFADVLSRQCPTPVPREDFETSVEDIIFPINDLSAADTGVALPLSAAQPAAQPTLQPPPSLDLDISPDDFVLHPTDSPTTVDPAPETTRADPVASPPPFSKVQEGTVPSNLLSSAQRADPDLSEIISALEKKDTSCRPARRHRLQDGLLVTSSGLAVVPPSLRPALLDAYHSAGHYSVDKMLSTLR